MSFWTDLGGLALHTAHDAKGAAHDVSHVSQEVLKAIEHLTPAEAAHLVEKGIHEALRTFVKALEGPILAVNLKLLEIAEPDADWLTIGPITFNIGDVPSKIESLKSHMKSPPKGKTAMRQLIYDLEPTDIEVALKISIPGVPTLAVGNTLIYRPDTFLHRIDHIWEELGI